MEDDYFMSIKCENCSRKLAVHHSNGSCGDGSLGNFKTRFFAKGKTIVRVKHIPDDHNCWYYNMCGHHFLVRLVINTYFVVMKNDSIDVDKAFKTEDLEIITSGFHNKTARPRERIFDLV